MSQFNAQATFSDLQVPRDYISDIKDDSPIFDIFISSCPNNEPYSDYESYGESANTHMADILTKIMIVCI